MKTVLANLERKAAVDTARYGRLLRHAEEDYRRIRNVGQFFPHKAEFYQHDIETCPLHFENLTGGLRWSSLHDLRTGEGVNRMVEKAVVGRARRQRHPAASGDGNR